MSWHEIRRVSMNEASDRGDRPAAQLELRVRTVGLARVRLQESQQAMRFSNALFATGFLPVFPYNLSSTSSLL